MHFRYQARRFRIFTITDPLPTIRRTDPRSLNPMTDASPKLSNDWHTTHYINGQWSALGDATFADRNPYNDEVVACVRAIRAILDGREYEPFLAQAKKPG